MQDLDTVLALAVRLSLLGFMVGSLLDMGLELRLRDALACLGNRRFLLRVLGFGFVAGPVLAWAISQALVLHPSHATGLMLIGLTPCAPFLPMMVRRARGDMPSPLTNGLSASAARKAFRQPRPFCMAWPVVATVMV